MKKIKYILFSAVMVSFIFITACSTTQSVPVDDVYYSATPHTAIAAKTTPSKNRYAKTTKNTETKNTEAYHEGTVENISAGSEQATQQTGTKDDYDVDYSARLKRFHDSNDTTLDYYDSYYEGRTMPGEEQQNNEKSTSSASVNYSFGLGFGSPYFGSSWSFGFGYPYSSWGLGFGFGGGYPYWGGGFYPPYYGYYPPYYGYYPPYYGIPPYYGVPPYYGYYPPYYPGYPDVGYRSVYQPRTHRGGSSSIPRSVVAGGSGISNSSNSKSVSTGSRSTANHISSKRVPIHPQNGEISKAGNRYVRPSGSVRYNTELARQRAAAVHAREKFNKPDGAGTYRSSHEGNRSPQFGISESRNRRAEGYRKPPAYVREETMPKPRFSKPKQYRSLESRSPRSSNEFYRTSPVRSNPESGLRNPVRVYSRPQPVRRQNVYRPVRSPHSVYRSRPHSDIKIYSAPSRVTFPNSYSPARRGGSRSNSSGSTIPTRNFSAPTRSFTVPTRSNSSGGGSSVRGNSGSGGIKR
jgi:hypothetical protein